MNPRKNKLVLSTIKDNQQDLLNYWNKVVVNGESIKYILNANRWLMMADVIINIDNHFLFMIYCN